MRCSNTLACLVAAGMAWASGSTVARATSAFDCNEHLDPTSPYASEFAQKHFVDCSGLPRQSRTLRAAVTGEPEPLLSHIVDINIPVGRKSFGPLMYPQQRRFHGYAPYRGVYPHACTELLCN